MDRPADPAERQAVGCRVGGSNATLAPTLAGAAVEGPVPPREVANYEIIEKSAGAGWGWSTWHRHRALRRLVALKMILAGGFASEPNGSGSSAEGRGQRRASATPQHRPGLRDRRARGAAPSSRWSGSAADRMGTDPWSPHDAARLVETLALAIDAAIEYRRRRAVDILLGAKPAARPSVHWPGPSPRSPISALARPIEGGHHLTSTGLAVGTPNTWPRSRPAGLVGPAADVYALGAMLYQLLTGRLPFMADTPIEVLQALTSIEPVAPQRLGPACRDLETIVLKAIEGTPTRRYAAAGTRPWPRSPPVSRQRADPGAAPDRIHPAGEMGAPPAFAGGADRRAGRRDGGRLHRDHCPLGRGR